MKIFIIQLVVLGCLLTISEAYRPGLVRNTRTRRDTTQQKAWVTDLVDQSQGQFSFCGGTLVGSNRLWVVTAGHCMQNRNAASIQNKMLVNSEIITASKVVIHPLLYQFDNDLALIKLNKAPDQAATHLPFWNPGIGNFQGDVCYIGLGTDPVNMVDTNTCKANVDLEYCAAVPAFDADFVLMGDALWCIRNGQKYMAGLVSNVMMPDDNNLEADRIFGVTPMWKYIDWIYQVRTAY